MCKCINRNHYSYIFSVEHAYNIAYYYHFYFYYYYYSSP